MKSFEETKRKLAHWEKQVWVTTTVYDELRRETKEYIEYAKRTKASLNQSIRDLHKKELYLQRIKAKAKREVYEAKTKSDQYRAQVKRYPSEVRAWTKKNIGKVIQEMEE